MLAISGLQPLLRFGGHCTVIEGSFDVGSGNLQTVVQTTQTLLNSLTQPDRADICATVSDGPRCFDINPNTKSAPYQSEKGRISVRINHPDDYVDRSTKGWAQVNAWAKEVYQGFNGNADLIKVSFKADKSYMNGPGPLIKDPKK